MINSINEESGSTKNESVVLKVPALIQSNSTMVCDTLSGAADLRVKKTAIETPNDASIAIFAIKLATVVGNFLFNKLMIKKPISGNKGTNQINLIIIIFTTNYHLSLFNKSMSVEPLLR